MDAPAVVVGIRPFSGRAAIIASLKKWPSETKRGRLSDENCGKMNGC
jgi:hypothetical protein